MAIDPLPFEQDIHELELLLDRVEADPATPADELRRIKRELAAVKKHKYANLSAWETVLVARHPKRPQFLDYVDLCFDEFVELHGDRAVGDDRALRAGFARVGDFKVMLIGHHKGRTLAERQQCFYGCAHPEGYRKALAKMKTAAKFGVPVVFLSGDQTIGEEARRLLGPIETVAVKTAGGFYSGTMLHPEECQRLIREGVKRGIEKRRQLKPYKLARPVKLEVTFKWTVYAEIVSYFRGVERPRGNAIVYTANDMLDASRFFSAIGFLHVD